MVTQRIVSLAHEIRIAGEGSSYMSVKNLRELNENSTELLQMVDEETDLPDWVEALVTESAVQLRNVYHYMKHGEGGDATEDVS